MMNVRGGPWVGFLGVALVFVPYEEAAAQAPGLAMPVAVAPIVERQVLAGRTFVGTVNPSRKSSVGSAVEERVELFPVNEGDRVEAGQVLARLESSTQEIELDAARSELEYRKQLLAELENGTRSEEIAQGQARLIAAQSRRDLAEIQRTRVMNLRQTRAVSAEELDQAMAQSQEADQVYAEARAALDLLIAGPRQEQIKQAQARVLGQEQEIKRLEDVLAKYTIEAPFAGYVSAEYTEVGQWVSKGQLIVDLVALDTVEVSVPVLEDYVPFLNAGDEAEVRVDALPGEVFKGVVRHVVPQADPRSRSFPVLLVVGNREGENGELMLKGGMFARVTLQVEEKKALLADKDAVVLGGPSPVVFKVTPSAQNPREGTAEMVPVTLGISDGGLFEILGPLQVGDLVIVEGNERIRPGQQVLITQTEEPGARRGGPGSTDP